MTETHRGLDWNARLWHPAFAENFQSPRIPFVPLVVKKYKINYTLHQGNKLVKVKKLQNINTLPDNKVK